MSVLIKDMKMPRSCVHCRFSGFGGLRNERVVCMFTGANAYMNAVQYLEDCPLVEVPTPHGKLVDKQEIIRNSSNSWTKDDWFNSVVNATTIIPAEEDDR